MRVNRVSRKRKKNEKFQPGMRDACEAKAISGSCNWNIMFVRFSVVPIIRISGHSPCCSKRYCGSVANNRPQCHNIKVLTIAIEKHFKRTQLTNSKESSNSFINDNSQAKQDDIRYFSHEPNHKHQHPLQG